MNPRSAIGAGILLVATIAAPWLHGPWASARFAAVCVTPGLATLLWLAPGVLRSGPRAVAATLLTSAVLAPGSLFLALLRFGNLDTALLASALLWGAVWAAAIIFRMAVHHESPGAITEAAAAGPNGWGGIRCVAMLIGATLLIALPLLLNGDLRVRSDAWTHIGLVRKIVTEPYPWTDPRFAGYPLRYFWFMNLWAAGFAARSGTSFSWGLTLINLTGLAASLAGLLTVTRRFLPTRGLRLVALGVAACGLNPLGAYGSLTQIASALLGRTRTAGSLGEAIAPQHFLDADVTETLTFEATSYVGWIDKYLVITAFGIGMAAAILLAGTVWESARERRVDREQLTLLALGFAATLFHHPIAALILGVTLGAALIVPHLLRQAPLTRRQTLRMLGAMALACLAAAPYLASILQNREAHGSGFGFGLQRVWILTILAVLGPLIALLVWEWRTLRERLGAAWVSAVAFVATALAFALGVTMPSVNENKAIILFFCIAAPFGAPGVVRLHRWAWRRIPWRIAWLAVLASAVAVPSMIWLGYLLQREPQPSVAAAAAGQWIRSQTPADAVLIEPVGARLLMNRAERDMWVSDATFIRECGYPRAALEERIRLVDMLYETGEVDSPGAENLRGLQRPIYLFVAPETGAAATGTRPIEPSPSLFEGVFRSGEAAVYRLRPRS